jgi:hypothetical protein
MATIEILMFQITKKSLPPLAKVYAAEVIPPFVFLPMWLKRQKKVAHACLNFWLVTNFR